MWGFMTHGAIQVRAEIRNALVPLPALSIEAIAPTTIPANWRWMRRVLSKAIEADPDRDDSDVYEDLCNARMSAFVVGGESQGVIVTQTIGDWLWVIYAAGALGDIAAILGLMRGIEHAAQQRGLTEIHIVGRRGWARPLAALGFNARPSSDGLFHIWKVL